jgi:heme/copper-type cytochrome/quinol oxidase subunit 2
MKAVLSVALLYLVVAAVHAAEPRVVEIKLDSYSIAPDTITVKVNVPVIFKVSNAATFIPHNLVIKAPEAGIDIKIDVRAGKTGEAVFTPTKSGTYEMFCDKTPPIGKSHKDKGMHGKLIVE